MCDLPVLLREIAVQLVETQGAASAAPVENTKLDITGYVTPALNHQVRGSGEFKPVSLEIVLLPTP